jgi:hypothetical protein
MSNANTELGDVFTLPCVASCVMATIAAGLAARTSYVMGSTSTDRGSAEYRRAYWALCCAMLCASCAFATIKMLE